MAGARHRWRRAKADTGRWSDCLDWPRDGDRRFGSSARWLSVRLWRRTLRTFPYFGSDPTEGSAGSTAGSL